MNQKVLAFRLLFARVVVGGTLTGHTRHQNSYAQYQSNPFGVGYYEFARKANANSRLDGLGATDVFGVFFIPYLTAGSVRRN